MLKKICNILIQLGIITLLVFPPIVFGAVQLRHVTYIQMLILAIGVVWTIKTLNKKTMTYAPTPLDLPLLLLVVLGILNLLMSTYAHNTERELYLLVNYALLYFLVVQHLKTTRRIIGFAFIIILVGSGESLFGLFQYLRGAKTVLGQITPNIGTVNATYFSHNHFAGFLIMIIPLALGLLIGAGNLEKRFFLFLLIGLMGGALVLTLSRGGLLSFFLALGIFLAALALKNLSSRKARSFWPVVVILLLLAVCVGLAILWIGVSPIAHRSVAQTFFPTEDILKNEIRLTIWQNALVLVKEFPLFGSGLGTFEYVFLRYRPEALPQDRQAFYAHNDYLELLIEMGIPALILAIWAIVRFFRYIIQGYLRHSDPILTSLALGGLASCAAMFIHSVFDFNLQIPANAVLFIIVLALTTATIRLMNQGHSRTRKVTEETAGKKRVWFLLNPYERYRAQTSWPFLIGMIAITGILLFNFRTILGGSYYSRAKTAQYQHRLFQALPLYQKAIAFNGGNAMFHESLGGLLRQIGKTSPHGEKWYAMAVEEYQTAITLNTYNPQYYSHLGWTYNALGKEPEAVQAFRSAIRYNPRIAFYHEQLGNYFLSIDQPEAAMNAYRDAIRQDAQRLEDILKECQQYELGYAEYHTLIPDDADSRRTFANWLAQQGDWEASKQEYRKAINLSGQQIEFYNAMLEACEKQRDFDCMRMLWGELGQQHPESLEFPLKIADSFVRQQAWDQAIRHYQEMLREHPHASEVHERLGQLYQQVGRHDDAIDHYRQLIAAQPDEVTFYHHLVNIYTQTERWQDAIAVYKTALDHGIVQADIYANLGDLYARAGQNEQSVNMYEQAVQTGETRIAVYQKLTQHYQEQGNDMQSAMAWETYMLNNRESPEDLFQLVKHYQAQGEWLNAVTLAKEVIANTPSNTGYRKFLADLYEQKEMLFETIEQWEKIVKLHAGNIQYHLYLAGLYEQVKDWDNARLQYREILRLQPDNQQVRQKLSSLGG